MASEKSTTHGRGGVVADDHIAGEERSARAGVEETRAAGAGEAENAANDVAGAGGNVGDDRALAAAGGPTGCGTRLSKIALAGLKHYRDLVYAGDDVARCGRRASARGCEAAGGRDEGKMGGVWHRGNGE